MKRRKTARRALIPGSFDPVTNGHLDVIRRASTLFDDVVVAVLANTGKTPWFTARERVGLIEAEARSLPNVRVRSFGGLLVDFARRARATVVVRGLRGGADLENEMAMARTNRDLDARVETVFLGASSGTQHVASRLVREIGLLGGRVDGLVPRRVAVAVRARAAALRKAARS